MEPKPWYQSRTIWLNVGTFFALATPVITGYTDTLPWSPETALQVATTVGFVNALMSIALRVWGGSQPPISGGAP